MKKLLIPIVIFCSLMLGCRTSKPPSISIICIGDGAGGADCVDSAGNKVYKKPSELKNFWMTTQYDEANFTAWCYDTSPAKAAKAMSAIKKNILF